MAWFCLVILYGDTKIWLLGSEILSLKPALFWLSWGRVDPWDGHCSYLCSILTRLFPFNDKNGDCLELCYDFIWRCCLETPTFGFSAVQSSPEDWLISGQVGDMLIPVIATLIVYVASQLLYFDLIVHICDVSYALILFSNFVSRHQHLASRQLNPPPKIGSFLAKLGACWFLRRPFNVLCSISTHQAYFNGTREGCWGLDHDFIQ